MPTADLTFDWFILPLPEDGPTLLQRVSLQSSFFGQNLPRALGFRLSSCAHCVVHSSVYTHGGLQSKGLPPSSLHLSIASVGPSGMAGRMHKTCALLRPFPVLLVCTGLVVSLLSVDQSAGDGNPAVAGLTAVGSDGGGRGDLLSAPFDASYLENKAGVPNYHDDDETKQCSPIRESVCQGLQYSDTLMPNWVKMMTQTEAAKRMHDYQSLLNVQCSHYLKLLLCTIYFPMCTPLLQKPTALHPCKKLCLHVKRQCEPIMKSFQFPWPDDLACHSLPDSDVLCIQPNNYSLDERRARLPSLLPVAASGLLEKPQVLYEMTDSAWRPGHMSADSVKLGQSRTLASGGPGGAGHNVYPRLDELLKGRDDSLQAMAEQFSQALGRKDAIDPPEGLEPRGPGASHCSAAELPIVHDTNDTCLVHCHADLLYRRGDKQFARLWTLVWSVFCAVSSALTVITFLADRPRFHYPERPIAYLSVCFLALAIGHLLALGLGHERAACRPVQSIDPTETETETATASASAATMGPGETGEKRQLFYLVRSGHEGTWCTIVFLIVYYFGTASHLWWVMLSLAWYLSASRKWSHEGVESVSSVFHLFAWALPALFAVFLLILHQIDADELTGVCSVGQASRPALLLAVILPQAVCLLLGLLLLGLGFSAVFRVRRDLKTPSSAGVRLDESAGPAASGPANRRRLEKLIAKLGVFSILYTVPVFCLLAGNLYEYLNRPAWHSALRRLQASRPDCLSPRGLAWQQPGCQPETGPSPESAMLRIFSSLVVGITSGMWVWANRKTVLIWHQLAVNCVCCGRGCRATRAMTAPPAYLCPTGPSPRRPDGLRAVGGGPLLHSLPYDLGLVGRETGEAGVYATGRGFPARLTASTMHCLTNGGGGGGGGGHLLVGGQTAPSGAQQMAAGQVGANISSAGSGSAVNSASGTMPSHVQMVSTANGPSSLSGPPSHLYSSGGYSLGPANLATAAAPHLSELAVESAGQATDGLAGARLTHPLFLPDEAQPLSGSSGLKEFVCLSGPPSTTSASGPDYPAYPPASMTAYSMPPAPATHQALLRPDQAQPGLFVEPSVGVILASGASSSSKTSHKYASCV